MKRLVIWAGAPAALAAVLVLRLVSGTSSSAAGAAAAAAAGGEGGTVSAGAVIDAGAGGGELAEVPLRLPRPAYVGTPKQIRGVSNLELPPSVDRRSFLAPRGTRLVSARAPVTSSEKDPIIGALDFITDGDREGTDGSYVELCGGTQWVQLDLGRTRTVTAVMLWHRFNSAVVYRDVVIQVSDDADFISGVTTVYNNDQDNSSGLGLGRDREYLESHQGKLIAVPKVGARYVRLHSRGSTDDDQNHYVEVDVYGIESAER